MPPTIPTLTPVAAERAAREVTEWAAPWLQHIRWAIVCERQIAKQTRIAARQGTYRRKLPHETQNLSRRPRYFEPCCWPRLPENPDGANARYTQRRRAVQRRSRLHQGANQVRGAHEAVLRQADKFYPTQELRARVGEAVF